MNQNITKAILPLAALSCFHGKMLAQDAARPNILYIMCDDHAMQAISAYGSPISKLAPTPNMIVWHNEECSFATVSWKTHSQRQVELA